MIVFLACYGLKSQVIIGNISSNKSNPRVILAFNKETSTSSIIYGKDEINTAGKIYKVSFYVANTPSCNGKVFKMYMRETSQDNYGRSFGTTPTSASLFGNSVFNGSINWVNGWNEITLTTPFNFSNTTKNLEFLFVDDTNDGGCSNYPKFKSEKWAGPAGCSSWCDSRALSNGPSSFDMAHEEQRPIVKLNFFNIEMEVDTSICEGKSYQFTSVSVTPNTPTPTFKWTSNNGGTFNDDTSLNPTYTPTITNGTVTLTLQATGTSGIVSKSFTLTVKPKPLAIIEKK